MNQHLLSYIILKQHVRKITEEIGLDATLDILYRVVKETVEENGQNTALQHEKNKIY